MTRRVNKDQSIPMDATGGSLEDRGVLVQHGSTHILARCRISFFGTGPWSQTVQCHMDEFLTLEPHVFQSASRAHHQHFSAACPHQYRAVQKLAPQQESFVKDQVFAAELKPRRFRTMWQRRAYDGATARQDAENVVRTKWLHIVSDLT